MDRPKLEPRLLTRRFPSSVLAVCAAVLLLGGCIGPPSQGGGPAGTQSDASPTRTLIMLIKSEFPTLAARIGTGGSDTGLRSALFTAGLAYRDDNEVSQPVLAVSPPALNTDDWRLYPDGRMETTYRLKPHLTWHDGTPLMAEDFVFVWRVVSGPKTGVFSPQAEDPQIEEVLAPDSHTVVFRWRGPYREAGVLGYDPLPRHILEKPFLEDDPATFVNLPYWTREFVHLGPYRVQHWEPGVSIEAAAFDNYVLGRPKIERVRVIWAGDPNVAVTYLLSGAAHIANEPTISFREAVTLKRAWTASGEGVVLLEPRSTRYIQFQRRPEYAKPAAIGDLRVRKALAHSVDKTALANAMLEGEGQAANSVVNPRIYAYPAVERAVVKYPYDLRRADQLMQEAGFVKSTDGVYGHATDGRFAPELRGFAGGDEDQAMAILADGWGRAGMDVSPYPVPAAQNKGGEVRSIFPALGMNGVSAAGSMRWFATSEIPRADNGWVGLNRGAWSNPEFDRLYQLYTASFDRETDVQLTADMYRVHSEDLGALPLYYNTYPRSYVSALSGPVRSSFSNLHEWVWR